MEDSDSSKKPFYGGSEDLGRVADVGAAQELAYLENPARDREAALKKEAETGLTEEQRANIEIMDGIEEKYPLAFQKFVDAKGRKVLALSVVGNQNGTAGIGSDIFITQEGIICHSGSRLPRDGVDFTKLLDRVSSGGYIDDRGLMIFEKKDVLKPEAMREYEGREILFFRADLEDTLTKENMRTQFKKSQEWREGYLREQVERQAKLDPKAVLSGL